MKAIRIRVEHKMLCERWHKGRGTHMFAIACQGKIARENLPALQMEVKEIGKGCEVEDQQDKLWDFATWIESTIKEIDRLYNR